MKSEERKRVIEKLVEKGAVLPCPRCGHKSFTLADGYSGISIQEEIEGIILGGKRIPIVVAICGKCGFISQHALGTLGLLLIDEKDKDKS